ncbi:MAG: HDOD domain-containing protein [Desulfuromonadaceae bacterium]|nr:HDOD domain-containing protein [Desulfuromonadaceae bacterium]MDD2847989.1 HDOD domain-containing protein [Desulfuromonadaceae bacterium]MDD4131269.1 HDOD domain-containing protein [Desulfuromonadaceae bacterium]
MDKVAMMINARKLFKDVSDLPTIPAIVSRVVSMLDSQDASPDEVADLILSDQVLAARVIRVVNSPLYRTSNTILSVKRALLFLGFKSVREMILTSYFVDSFKNQEQPFDMKMFWVHSFSVGAISRRIARMIEYNDVEKAYLVGIIHDIGKVFLGHYCKEEYGRMLAGISNTSSTTYDAEYESFGTTHCEVGLCLALRWNFPPAYCDVIANHHSSEVVTEDPLLLSIVALADFYCLSHGTYNSVAQASIPGASEDNAWEVLSQFATDSLPTSLEHFLSALDEEYEAINQEVNQLFNTMTI